jgi:hypothetical protein
VRAALTARAMALRVGSKVDQTVAFAAEEAEGAVLPKVCSREGLGEGAAPVMASALASAVPMGESQVEPRAEKGARSEAEAWERPLRVAAPCEVEALLPQCACRRSPFSRRRRPSLCPWSSWTLRSKRVHYSRWSSGQWV